VDINILIEKHPITGDVAITATCYCCSRYRGVIAYTEELLNAETPEEVIEHYAGLVTKKLELDHEGR
jgi:hypothetical protein